MASVATQVYRMCDFEKIMSDGFNYLLPPSVIEIIQKLSKNVGAPDYIKTPKFEARIQKKIEDSPESWIQVAKPIKSTKSKLEETIDAIKINLNKLTDKSFDTQTECVIKNIAYIQSISTFDDMDKTMTFISDFIYEISSSNLFYAKVYAKLFNELILKFPFMIRPLRDSIAKSSNNLFPDFEYVNLEVDYDKFCDFNKSNEKRKAMVSFYIHLVKLRVIGITPIINMLTSIQTRMVVLISDQSNAKLVDEMAEISFILITNLYTYIKNNNFSIHDDVLVDRSPYKSTEIHEQSNSQIDECVVYITNISNSNTKTSPGLSNRAKFKHMDMLANINLIKQ